MEYLIIIFVVFIALSPLISMRPSPKKLKQARLRQTAATLGMVVTFSDMPARYKSDKPQKGICYRLLRQGKRIKQAPSPATYQRSNEGWLRDSRLVTEDSKASIDIELLNSLPGAVAAVSIGADSCAAYWLEEGDTQEVEQIGLFVGIN